MAKSQPDFDRYLEYKSFDETKAGVKGLVDEGVTQVPRIFIRPPEADQPLPDPKIQLEIPVIDLQGVDSAQQVCRAAEAGGFFQLVNHGVPVRLLDQMMEAVRRFFEKPKEEKVKYYARDMYNMKVSYNSNHELYSAPVADWRDSMYCFMAPNPPEPEELPVELRDTILEYSKHIQGLGGILIELLSESLGLKPNHLKEMGCIEGLAIVSHYYPPCPEPELALGTAKHTDNAFFTVLLQDRIGGLQALQQNQWVDIKPVDGALVVNIGDLLQLVSNDRFKSGEHRVLANKEGPRVSVASFLRPFGAAAMKVIGPIEELLSEENPPVYRATSITEYSASYTEKRFDGMSALALYKL